MYKIIGADGKEYGPIPADVLRQWIAEGRADAHTRVLPEGAAEWKLLGSLPEFAAVPGNTPAPTPPTAGYTQPAKNHPLAVTSLIMGMLALTCGFCCFYGLPFSVLGIVFGGIALGQIKQAPASHGGRGLAIAGLVLSVFSILLAVFLFLLGVAFNASDVWQRVQNL